MKEKFIPGIFNYCDRWCERCTFTSRCRNYERTGKLEPEQLDSSNQKFWDTISANFKETMEMIHKMAKEKGIDLDNVMTKEEIDDYNKKEALIRKEVREHELIKLCKRYQKIVLPFFEKEAKQHIVNRSKELVCHLEIGVATEDAAKQVIAGLEDCTDIIQWYVFFIDAKLQRALHGKLEGEEDAEEYGFPKDSEGSAKIAIIAIEKSSAAWVRLFELMPSAEDTALNVLAILSRLRKLALEEFPQALAFKRPGFDG
jgi:cell fate (sporulation/competence/biofilm development) regulator YmcA (YheA/YmcA/DUF963 family)